ncbi:apoptosis regulatory protein Siva [Gallus gallus]|uniref:apoptosis regulatory protein Siva n=1 Tax=Gallus gallus TaxID=9031 RepID=UPI0000E806C2|nr:apoptosis regulatory protein Siva [Gallus gallus]|eukprot:NP_001264464.1 apoptosis regulatory protein Siva [Gallus gallus]
MPKRSCPFGEAAPLQLKTRVGLRELSRGVRGEEYRREIFERTRRLLFRGAQACMEGAWPAAPRAASRSPEPESESGGESAGRRRSAQLQIGPDGKLLRCAAAAERVPPVGVSKACSSCVRAADVKEACAQCDRFVCQSCSRVCSCCNAVTCSLCSITDYGDVGEQVLCNGCSIFQV